MDKDMALPTARATHEPSPQAVLAVPVGIANAMREMHDAMEAEMNRVHGTDGWKLHDTPKFPEAMFQEFIDICGADNVRFVSGSEGNFRMAKKGGMTVSEPCEPWRRATLLLSPDAVSNCTAYAQGIEAGTAKTEGLGPKDESPVGGTDAPESGLLGDDRNG